MRVFVGIDVNEEIRKKLTEVETALNNNDFDIKFVEPKNLHITLKFLGDVDQKQFSEVCQVLENISNNFSKFRINVHGIGYFGNKNFIRVIWAGVKEGNINIISLIEQLNNNLKHIKRVEFNKNPHITIGRVKSGRNIGKLLNKLRVLEDMNFGEMNVNIIKIKKSVLTKGGPIYTDLKSFNLS